MAAFGISMCFEPLLTEVRAQDEAEERRQKAVEEANIPRVLPEEAAGILRDVAGKTFVVKADHPKVEYEGQSYWICSEQAAEQVRADPAKYLDGFEG